MDQETLDRFRLSQFAACLHSAGKEANDVFGRPGAIVGEGSAC